MQAESLEVLENAQVPAGQARAFVRAIEIEIEISGARDTLATKQDALLLRQDMESVRHGLESKIDGLRIEMQAMRGDLKAEIHILASRSTGQLLAATLTLMSMLVGIFYFLLTRSVH